MPRVDLDPEVVGRVESGKTTYEAALEKGALAEALRAVCELAVFGNEYFQRKRPWETKDEAAVASGVHLVKGMAIQLRPYVPRFASAVLSVLGVSDPRWDDIDRSIGGAKLGEERVLLERIDVGEIRGCVEREEGRAEEAEVTISLSDLEKIDLRVGVIASASVVEGADKLLALSVDFGDRTRSCVAGIKESYAPDDLIGKRVVAVVNLEPRTIRGLQSECMLLAARGEEFSLAVVDRPVEPGTAVS